MKKDAKKSQDNEQGFDINTDENLSGTTHLNDPLTDEPELEKMKAELEAAEDKYVRKVAEFENFKRRTAKERIELIQTAGREVIVDLLEILDDCDRAQKQLDEMNEFPEAKEGVLLVFNKIRHTLQAKGLRPMQSVGEVFNPDLHEAITEVPAPDPKLAGKVIDEVVKGYFLNDKIIRYAKVVVGK